MRLFLASLLATENQTFYREFVAGLVEQAPHVMRGVPAGSIHLTCAFFPEVPDTGADALTDLVMSVAQAHTAFTIGLGSPQVLWGRRTPRLIEIPIVSGEGDYTRLADALAAAIRRELPSVTFSPSKAPHATIARFRKQATRADAQALTGALATPGRSDRVDAIALVTSVLGRQGPAYEVKATVPLGASDTYVPPDLSGIEGLTEGNVLSDDVQS